MTLPHDRKRESLAFIAVGSNIDPEANIAAALMSLAKKVHVRGSSTFYQTDPIGTSNQPPFVNGVWAIETTLEPIHMRNKVLHAVECELGRVRTTDKYAPRVIDLDLILYGDSVIDDGGICLPHPDISRPFVHVPILELLSECSAGEREAMTKLLPNHARPTVPGALLLPLTQKLRELIKH